MNARLVYVTNRDGSKSVRAEYEVTECGSHWGWWTIGWYKTEKGARIAAAARARYFEDYLSWCCPMYVNHQV